MWNIGGVAVIDRRLSANVQCRLKKVSRVCARVDLYLRILNNFLLKYVYEYIYHVGVFDKWKWRSQGATLWYCRSQRHSWKSGSKSMELARKRFQLYHRHSFLLFSCTSAFFFIINIIISPIELLLPLIRFVINTNLVNLIIINGKVNSSHNPFQLKEGRFITIYVEKKRRFFVSWSKRRNQTRPRSA